MLGCLVLIYRFMLGSRRGRAGRPPRGVLTRYLSPADQPLAVVGMGGYALGTAIVVVDPRADAQSGMLIGLLLAVVMAPRSMLRLTVAALGVVGFVCALIQMGSVIVDGEFDALARWYRVALVGLVLVCFAAGALFFDRASALRGERGLALLGVADVVGFLSRPSVVDLSSLEQMSHALFLLGASATAFVVGWAVSEATLGLVGIAVVGLSVALGGPDGWLGVVAAVSAVAFTVVAHGVRRLFSA